MAAPLWLIDSVRSAVHPTGVETADWYETADEYVVLVRGREFVISAARGRGVPRGPLLVLRYARDGSAISVALPYQEPDISTLGPRHRLALD